MSDQGRLHSLLRAMRLMAVLSLIVALCALATIANGDSTAKSATLIAVAIGFATIALLGMGLAALPFILRKKEKNDPRS